MLEGAGRLCQEGATIPDFQIDFNLAIMSQSNEETRSLPRQAPTWFDPLTGNRGKSDLA